MLAGRTFPTSVFLLLVTLIAGLLIPVRSFSQEPVFRHYTTMDGLPSSETYCVVQDEKGYMWIATDRGLTKFNGYDFKVFTSGQTGLLDNTIFWSLCG